MIRRWLPRSPFGLAVAGTVLLGLLLVAVDALARPGGGQGYSGGGGGGFGGGGGGGGGDGDLVGLILFLVIQYPEVGVPVAIVAVVVWVVRQRSSGKRRDWATTMAAPVSHRRSAAVSPRRALEGIREFDPDFSLIVFEDFLHALYQKTHEARGAGKLEHLSGYLTSDVCAQLAARAPGIDGVEGIVVGSLHYQGVAGIEDRAASVRVLVVFEANYTERAGEQTRGFYVVERWGLRRGRNARSRPPEAARVFVCPKCGGVLDGFTGGTCGYCSTRIDTGDFDWVVERIDVVRTESRPPALTTHAEEVGTDLPTVMDPAAAMRLQAVSQRDPAFSAEALQTRVRLIHREINEAWSARSWTRARPFVSDSLFESQLYWMRAYERAGLRNVIENPRVTRIDLAAVSTDRWYDAVTIRVFASSLDYTVREADARVVSGSKRRERAYSEYWTLIRGVGAKGAASSEATCPNCGAALDKVNQGGVCEYCNARVTTGEFDWVLSRIEQDESYTG